MSFRTFTNKLGVTFDATKTSVIFAEDMNDIVDAIEAMSGDVTIPQYLIPFGDSDDVLTTDENLFYNQDLDLFHVSFPDNDMFFEVGTFGLQMQFASGAMNIGINQNGFEFETPGAAQLYIGGSSGAESLLFQSGQLELDSTGSGYIRGQWNSGSDYLSYGPSGFEQIASSPNNFHLNYWSGEFDLGINNGGTSFGYTTDSSYDFYVNAGAQFFSLSSHEFKAILNDSEFRINDTDYQALLTLHGTQYIFISPDDGWSQFGDANANIKIYESAVEIWDSGARSVFASTGLGWYTFGDVDFVGNHLSLYVDDYNKNYFFNGDEYFIHMNLQAFDDEADAVIGGVPSGALYQTTGAGVLLPVAGVVMMKQ